MDGIVGGTLISDELNGVTNNGYSGFDPIGRNSDFTGTFDGGGYTISNLWIFRKDTNIVGLFGFVVNGTVTNLTLENAQVVGAEATGVVVGSTGLSTFSNITISNSMNRAYLSTAGGLLAGRADDGSTITNITITNGVSHGSGNIIGGLIGRIENSTVTGATVNADVDGGNYIGGAFGSIYNSTISSVDYTGNILISDEGGKYIDHIGGFVGYASDATISDSSAQGAISIELVNEITEQTYKVCGFVGSTEADTDISESFADVDIDITVDEGGPEVQLGQVGGFVDYFNSSGGDGIITDSYTTGDVSITGAYYMSSVGGFAGQIYQSEVSGSYAEGSIDLIQGFLNAVGGFSGYTWNADISDSYATGAVEGTEDVGGFVGDVNTENQNSGYVIENSFATGVVTGNRDVGGFVGQLANANIYNSYSTGTVTGQTIINEDNDESESYQIGGFVGEASGSGIFESYSTSNTSGVERVGGLVGYNTSDTSIENSYARGNVTGEIAVGGLIGENAYSNIANAYATGEVEGDINVGGLIGLMEDEVSTVTNAYWDTQTTGQSISAAGSGRTSAQMKSFSNYPLVDHDEPYTLDGDQTYRYLRIIIGAQNGSQDVQMSEFTLYNDGQAIAWPGETNISLVTGQTFGGGEEIANLIDGNLNTKWFSYYDEEQDNYIILIDMGEEVVFDAYSWATGNDFPERDPSTWSLTGFTDITSFPSGEISGDVVLDIKNAMAVTSKRNIYVHLAADGWDFETIWGINIAQNDGYPFLRAIQEFIHSPSEQVVEEPRRRRSGTSGSRMAAITQTQVSGLPTSIEGLRALLVQLQAQLAQLLANTPASNNNPLVRDLQLNDQGDDVRTLQQLLISKGYSIPAGTTGFFGEQTRQALIKFQQDNNITPAQGYFGPVTRARINQ